MGHGGIERRSFLKGLGVMAAGLSLGPRASARASTASTERQGEAAKTAYRAVNGGPGENLAKVMEMMGGIEALVGSDDLVVIKPNVQWWSQGAPNLSAVKTFVDMIFERPGGFRGEVVLAENCHRGAKPWESQSSGWAHGFELNADLDGVHHFNDLCALLKKNFEDRFSICHWVDVQHGAQRVYGPGDGAGYVYCDGSGGVPLLKCENGCEGKDMRATVMTYPIFLTDRGTVVDFKNGIWEKGAYTGQPLKFINFAALNYHSTYCGMTSVIKNYMGITDLSGGPDPFQGGKLSGEYYNFHAFPFDKWGPGPVPGMLGKAIGSFMKTVRKADLNIVTAEWVGLSSRVDGPVARTRAVLASEDPVALDVHGAKYLLYPNSKIRVHDPDWEAGPLRHYLARCAEEMGGVMDESRVEVKSFDLGKGRLQGSEDLVVHGDVQWLGGVKPMLKYLLLRSGIV